MVRLGSRGRLGAAWALLDGRRAAFYSDRGVPRALVPVAASAEAGPATLGVGIAARGGEQRVVHPDHDRREGRTGRGTSSCRRTARAPRAGPRRPTTAGGSWPCCAPSRRSRPPAFSCRRSARPGAASASRGRTPGRPTSRAGSTRCRASATAGSTTRCRSAPRCARPPRAPCCSPGPLALSGETVVIDHGQGVLSVLQHLSRVDARVGDPVAVGRGRRPLGRHRPRPRADAAVARLPPRRRRGPDGDRPAAVAHRGLRLRIRNLSAASRPRRSSGLLVRLRSAGPR